MDKQKVKEVLSLQRCCIAAFRSSLVGIVKETQDVGKTLERVENLYHEAMVDIDRDDQDECLGCASLLISGCITPCDSCIRSGRIKDNYQK